MGMSYLIAGPAGCVVGNPCLASARSGWFRLQNLDQPDL